jgi:hypothetical protein
VLPRSADTPAPAALWCVPVLPLTLPLGARTGLISNEAIRNATSDATGVPADFIPFTSGTVEQEQNGVSAPRPAASGTPSQRE